jgi:hypothetical protein
MLFGACSVPGVNLVVAILYPDRPAAFDKGEDCNDLLVA